MRARVQRAGISRGGQEDLEAIRILFPDTIRENTFMVGIEDVLIRVTQRKFIGNGRFFSMSILGPF